MGGRSGTASHYWRRVSVASVRCPVPPARFYVNARAPQDEAGCGSKRFWLLFARLQKVTGPAWPWSARVAKTDLHFTSPLTPGLRP